MTIVETRQPVRRQWVRLLWQHWAAPGLTAVGSIAALPWVATAPLLICGAAVAGAASITAGRLSRRGARQVQENQAKLSIISVLNNIFPLIETYRDESPTVSNLRACVIIFNQPDPEGQREQVGRLAYSYGNYSRLERILPWKAGQGIIGVAFSKGITVKAPEDLPLPTGVADEASACMLTDDQQRAIAGKARTATAFPVRNTHGQTLAVLVVEDIRPPITSDLRRPQIELSLDKGVLSPVADQLRLTNFELPPTTTFIEAS